MNAYHHFEYSYQRGIFKLKLNFKFELALSAIFNMATAAVFLN